ncbi:MAG: PorT family protein [Bacteroidales bacterium]|nr:PorT family protein [Bacteroidales bacterium]
MKKTVALLTALMLCLAGLTCRAQDFEGGITAGVVTSQINGDGYGGYHQIGWTGGIFGRIPTDGPLSFQLELKYTLLGAHSSVDEIEYGYNPMDIRLHYVEMPITLRFNLEDLAISGLSLEFVTLELGLSADFLAKNSQSANNDGGFENPSWLFFSVTGNAGLQFEITERLGVNIRSMNSISPCRWNPESPSLFYGHYYNIALQAGLTYTILAP